MSVLRATTVIENKLSVWSLKATRIAEEIAQEFSMLAEAKIEEELPRWKLSRANPDFEERVTRFEGEVVAWLKSQRAYYVGEFLPEDRSDEFLRSVMDDAFAQMVDTRVRDIILDIVPS